MNYIIQQIILDNTKGKFRKYVIEGILTSIKHLNYYEEDNIFSISEKEVYDYIISFRMSPYVNLEKDIHNVFRACKNKIFDKVKSYHKKSFKDKEGKEIVIHYPSTYKIKNKWIEAANIIRDLKCVDKCPNNILGQSATRIILDNLTKNNEVKKILARTHFFTLIKRTNKYKYYSFKYDLNISFPKGDLYLAPVENSIKNIKYTKRDEYEDNLYGVDYTCYKDEIFF